MPFAYPGTRAFRTEDSALPRNLSLYVNKSTFAVGGDPHFGRMRTIPHWILVDGAGFEPAIAKASVL